MTTLTQANMLPSTSDKPQKPRHRASVACTLCRERRTRCIILPGESECTQCRLISSECVINFDDERRKPNSRAYIKSLNERIAALEKALQEKGQSAPTATALTDERHSSHSPVLVSTTVHIENDKPSQLGDISEQNEAVITDSDGYSPPSNLSISGNESMVSKLLSTRGHLSFDQLSGRLRYFGPTTNCHVHSDLHLQSEQSHRQALEQQRRTQRVINSLSNETHDYLMDSFWQHYNSVIHVIHKAAFEDGRENGGPFYSGFLHVCILAMGYRSADKSRPDMIKISLPNHESTIHKEAKFMLDYEIEQTTGIPSIAALLLLGDLECGVGRDNVGWLYAGMANRLCFDIGLHLDRSNSGLSQREIEIGRMTLLACVIYDKYWALFLGRPTSLKSSDLESYHLSRQFERLGKDLPAGPEKSLETQIYESLIELMEIAGKITERMDQASRLDDNFNLGHHAYVRMANLNRELEIWYSRLAKPLQWTPENVQSSPFPFFLLHQQYHVTMILLHQPFAKYGDIQPLTTDSSIEDYSPQPSIHLSLMSRTICTQHAVRVARIFWQHRQRFDTRQIFVTGMQHAGTAAIALIAALASLKDSSSRDANMHYLECLAAALEDMAQTYLPAERMSAVLQAVLVELRATLPKQQRIIPARRESSKDEEPERFMPSKRHQSSRTSQPRTILNNFIDQRPNASLSEMELPLLDSDSNSAMMNHASLDGFVVVSPRADMSNLDSAWPSLANSDPSALDFPMLSNPRSTVGNMPMPTQRSAWMGAETPAVSPPSTNAYVYSSSFPRTLNDRLNDDSGTSSSNLDFLTLLGADRGAFSSLGQDDEFRLLPTPSATPRSPMANRPPTSSKPPDQNFTANRLQDGSAARTMAGLDDLWDQMRTSNKR